MLDKHNRVEMRALDMFQDDYNIARTQSGSLVRTLVQPAPAANTCVLQRPKAGSSRSGTVQAHCRMQTMVQYQSSVETAAHMDQRHLGSSWLLAPAAW